MNVYKATFDLQASGFLSSKQHELTELYEADTIIKAKKMAEKEMKKLRKELADSYVPLITMRATITLKNIEKVE